MATNVVNLDALIPREDFEVNEQAQRNLTAITGIPIRDLETGFLLPQLRKPDFQRETSDWSPAKVLDLIKTFLDGDLVPAVILWQAGSKVFVIDGAHRLSALMAWVQNDYGDGEKSKIFFGNYIPPEQIKIADRTRKIVHAEIGAYGEYAAAVKGIGAPDEKMKARLSSMGLVVVPVQWIPATTAKQAEDSFFKINQAATPIDPTELRILKARKTSSAIAARAIVRCGTGHKYWVHFEPHRQAEIQKLGKEIYAALYEPPLDTPIKTLDLPIAGKGYGTLPFIFDLVNLSNKLKVQDSTTTKFVVDALPEDVDGKQTIHHLRNVKLRINRFTGTDPACIGPHPAVYVYTLGGMFQPAAFLATTEFLEQLANANRLVDFSKSRKEFEEFLIVHKDFISQLVHKFGSGNRSIAKIKTLYNLVFELVADGNDDPHIVKALECDKDFNFFVVSGGIELPGTSKKRFSGGMKTATYLKQALEAALRCSICGARMHKNSMHVDHDERVRDGGSSSLDNARMTHPFCNSTVKN
ncbi:MAG: GmrSD restriction endonuclease domain-containing protein [Gammaproteobacteria bacterium]